MCGLFDIKVYWYEIFIARKMNINRCWFIEYLKMIKIFDILWFWWWFTLFRNAMHVSSLWKEGWFNVSQYLVVSRNFRCVMVTSLPMKISENAVGWWFIEIIFVLLTLSNLVMSWSYLSRYQSPVAMKRSVIGNPVHWLVGSPLSTFLLKESFKQIH